ncbi:AraC family transcriptional regulator [Afifella sp. H1R]|uniref:helix-turn-helix domain-containing protein n=1 Tax=Afifella sp. H1R TaxID=2908841 RepID=UPI001F20C934|nr:AraC family transcriptional regulator [Afifella sp. H1R]MCF1503800.1 AraC family transcriptional regulator [Afifella sp. H1R]
MLRCGMTTTHSMGACPTEPVRTYEDATWRVELLPRQAYETRYTPERPVIGFAFDRQNGVHAFAGDRNRDFAARANGFAYLPAGCEIYSRSEGGGEYLRILRKNGRDARPRERHFSDFAHRAATNSAHRLRRQILLQDTRDPLAIEALALDLERAATAIIDGSEPRDLAAHWMTQRRMSRVEAIIEARFAQALTVAELAEALDLSADFFTRAFRAAFGRTPRDAIIDRRIRHARDLLLKGDAPLAAIALASGFSSHAHMTAQFSQRLGMCPSKFRRT